MGAVVEFRNSATFGAVLPARSARALVFRALRDAMAPDWSPLEAARRLVVDADGGALALRAAHRRLRLTTEARITPCQERALAAIAIAIADLEPSAESVAQGKALP